MIWTCNPSVPDRALYQIELYTENLSRTTRTLTPWSQAMYATIKHHTQRVRQGRTRTYNELSVCANLLILLLGIPLKIRLNAHSIGSRIRLADIVSRTHTWHALPNLPHSTRFLCRMEEMGLEPTNLLLAKQLLYQLELFPQKKTAYAFFT